MKRNGNYNFAWGRATIIALALLLPGMMAAPAVAAAGITTSPPANFKKVSSLVKLPDFLPGLGTLYVDPATLPIGPFLGYNHQGKLVNITYMVPLKDLDARKNFETLGGVAAGIKINNTEIQHTQKHPGAREPYRHSVQPGPSGRRGAALPHRPMVDQPCGRKSRDEVDAKRAEAELDMRSKSVSVRRVMGSAVKVFLAACLAGAAILGQATVATAATVEIKLMQTPAGKTYFDPAGVSIAPGDTVRWVQLSGFHSITAYHPSNDNHELRIPASATPWDSDILLADYPKRGATFEHIFTVPGVYDYFCKPHEMAGMVGRIVVGNPGDGPGTKPFGYAPDEHWKPVPEVARNAFPSVTEIMQKGMVRLP